MAPTGAGIGRRSHEGKYIEFPRIHGSLTSMKRSCAHRWKPRRRSWTGPSPALTSGPGPHRNIAAKMRKRRKSKTDSGRGVSPLRQSRDGSATLGSFHFAPHAKRLSIICSLVAPSGRYFREPATLLEDSIHQVCHSPKNTELTMAPGLENRTETKAIGVNRSQSE